MQYCFDQIIRLYNIRLVRESFHFVLMTGSIFIVGMVAMYFQAFQLERKYYMGSQAHTEKTVAVEYAETSFSVSELQATTTSAPLLPSSISVDVAAKNNTLLYDYTLEGYLKNELNDYHLAFNTLAPGRWLKIDALDTTVPIVDVPYASQEKLQKADFDVELTKGVVKYPFTGTPGDGKSHPLIFGHSSVDTLLAKDNPYGYVFYQLSKLQYGETIQVIWDGILHEYEVEGKTVRNPDKVSDEMLAYADGGDYLTLMACYPLLSDAKRMLVRAKYKSSKAKKIVYNHGSLKN